MWGSGRVVVVVPAWNEAPRIRRVLQTMPTFVDRIVVVDDASGDGTAAEARAVGDPRLVVLAHPENRGVGAAIATGYRGALAEAGSSRDAFVVMAGDGQMAPDDVPALVAPIAAGEADYVKGNRFRSRATIHRMPRERYLAGRVLSWATSCAIGVHVSDSQCGFTAISRAACEGLDLDGLWTGYGYPNDLLSQVALRGLRIAEVEVRAIYEGEVSRLRPRHVPRVAQLVARAFVRRVAKRLGARPL